MVSGCGRVVAQFRRITINSTVPIATAAQSVGGIAVGAWWGGYPESKRFTPVSFSRRRSSSRSSLRRSSCIERLEDRYALDGKLAITELMYQPPTPSPPLVADDYEFIEVQNIGDATINLGGMSFTSGIQFAFPAVDLVPQQFAIIAKNVTAFRSIYGPGPNVLGAYTSGVLSNGGEPITIERDGTIITDFTYDGSWYDATAGGSFSLVPADVNTTTLTPSEQLYWRPSAVAFGSPGAADAGSLAPDSVVVNELLAHTDLSRGDWIELKNTTDEAIDVGGWFLSDSNDNLKKFRIPFGTLIPAHGFITFTQFVEFDNANNPNSLVQFAFSEFGETAYLTQADNVGNLLGYRVSQDFIASDREVTFGQFVKSTGGTDFVYMQADTFGVENSNPRLEPIVINEILYAPNVGGDEYIELRNLSDMPITLADPANPQNTWRFTRGVDFTFPQGAVIPASGFALVTALDPAAFRTKYAIPAGVPIFGPYVGALSNQGEEVEISKPGAPDVTVPYYRVDRVNYDTTPPWPDGTDVGGVSLAKVNSAAYGNDGANWQPGPVGGTPGATNVTIITVSINNTTVVEPNTGAVTATLNIEFERGGE